MGQELSTIDQQTILQNTGLTASEARIYICLAHNPSVHRPMHIKQELGMANSTLYRSLQSLCSKGFLDEIHITGSLIYRLIPLTHALDNLAAYQRQTAKPLIMWQREREQ